MTEFDVANMRCGHCASTITKTVRSLDPDAKVEVDLGQKKVKVESVRERAALADALTQAGYPTA